MNKMRLSIITLSVVFASLFFSGCGEDTGEGSSGTPSELIGTYSNGCDGSSIMTLTITSSEYIDETIYYQDTNCTTENTIKTFSATISFRDTSIVDNIEVYNVDVLANNVMRTPKTDAEATSLNDRNECNFTDWVNGVAKDVTVCEFGASTFQVYSLMGISVGKLYTGTSMIGYEGNTSATRHIILSTYTTTKL